MSWKRGIIKFPYCSVPINKVKLKDFYKLDIMDEFCKSFGE